MHTTRSPTFSTSGFESGTTHSFVLEKRPELMWPASLYLEGSDQHRGWFHSSLLESCGTRGRAPYDAVLTHGFVVDGEGRKMSKSLGNVIAPEQVNERYGADILRLWVVSTDYAEDLRISDEILRHQVDFLPPVAQYAPLPAGELGRFRRARATAGRFDACAGTLGAAPTPRPRPRCPALVRGVRVLTRCSWRCTTFARSISRPSISTFARIRFIATRTLRCAGAPSAPCSIRCSIA